MALRIVLVVLGACISLALIGLFAAAVSGRAKRAYPVMPPDQMIQINGESRKVSEWAAEFQPLMMLRSTTATPPLLWVYYEVVEQPDEVTFVYYHVWEDEIHPNPIYHNLYSIFRAAYYGFPVRDIEYFQVGVNRQTGQVSNLLFETSPGSDYYVTYSVHLVERLTKNGSGVFSMKLSEKNGQLISTKENVAVRFQNQRVLVGAATWNHLTQLVTDADADFTISLPAPLKFLSDADYSGMKFVRKSHGDYSSKDSALGLVFGGLSGLVLLSPFVLLMRGASLFKRKQ